MQKTRLARLAEFVRSLLFNKLERVGLYFGVRKIGFERSFGRGFGLVTFLFRGRRGVGPRVFAAFAIEFAAFDNRRGGRKVFTEEVEPFFVGGDAAIEFFFHSLVKPVDSRGISDPDEDGEFDKNIAEIGKGMRLAIELFEELIVPEGREEFVEGERAPFSEGEFFDDEGFSWVARLIFCDEIFVYTKEVLPVLIAKDGSMRGNEIAKCRGAATVLEVVFGTAVLAFGRGWAGAFLGIGFVLGRSLFWG